MNKAFTKLAIATAVGLLTLTSIANAQSGFDPKQFFDDLQKQGAQLPQGFDGKKYFDDLQKQGAQSFDPKQFFDDLQKQGAKLPTAFDPQKFFDDMQKLRQQNPADDQVEIASVHGN